MPFLNIDGLRVYYRLDGGDHQPVLILSHSLGQDHGMWDPQIPDLARHFRVLRYDLYGRGLSDRPRVRYNADLYDRQVSDLLIVLHLQTQNYDAIVPHNTNLYAILKYLALVTTERGTPGVVFNDHASVPIVFTLYPEKVRTLGWSQPGSHIIGPADLA